MSDQPPQPSVAPAPQQAIPPQPTGSFGDFLSFKTMITPLVIKILFIVGVVMVVLGGMVMVVAGAANQSYGAALLGLVYIFVGPLVVRVYCEILILFFRMYETLLDINRNTAR